jgi:glutamate transport system substrate-binding protein
MRQGTNLPEKITDLKQLKGKRVCTLGTSTSEAALSKRTETPKPSAGAALPNKTETPEPSAEAALFARTGIPEPGAKETITGKNLLKDCVDGLKEGEFEAVSTDAALLAGFVAESNRKGAKESEKLRHHDIAKEPNEKWAVNAGPNTALSTLVNLSLYRSYADPRDERWERAYAKYIVPLMSKGSGNDNMKMRVAAAEQPCVLPPPVRRWPWERTLSIQEC